MQIIYTGEEMPETITKSIFLAGPSLRPEQEGDFESWRKDAIKILEDKGFDGTVFCPENRDFSFKDKDFNYDNQVEWEDKYLNLADCILFWVPRDLSLDKNNNLKMPAFTTNVEFGAWCSSGKIVFGAPEDAEKITYLKYYSEKYNVPINDTLTETINSAIDMLGKGAERVAGERYVPLFLWNTESFKNWYKSQTKVGNRLDEAKLLYTFRPGNKNTIFLWILKVNIFIESENRNKINEFVLSRTDISSICLYYESPGSESIFDKEIVLVREFRSPASTDDGFILEFVGGSSKPGEEPIDIIIDEVLEETGFVLSKERLEFIKSRQLAGTLSSHKSHLFSFKLNKKEIDWFKSQSGVVHGNEKDSERTFIEVHNLKDIIQNNLCDWTTLGQLLEIIYK